MNFNNKIQINTTPTDKLQIMIFLPLKPLRDKEREKWTAYDPE